ncbi:MAG: hypothetical protein H6981_07005 [Gammaproteobacteria bacterium]|nr:hypothetical protein [Gammaproteobacteria bacterium]MCP5136531.1 hypothetical protein [Gammaproteobacteria bacterium]
MASVRVSMLVLMCLLPLTAPTDWALDVSPASSSDGVFRLHWEGPGNTVSLEESTQGDFEHLLTVYAGDDRAVLISGKADGVYRYRLLDEGRNVVANATATVVHHPLARAWAFFSIGLLVFLATVWVVARGARGDDEVKS